MKLIELNQQISIYSKLRAAFDLKLLCRQKINVAKELSIQRCLTKKMSIFSIFIRAVYDVIVMIFICKRKESSHSLYA